MDISIDMLSVGNANAIAVWLKHDAGSFVVVIDGGNKDDGKKLIAHMDEHIFPHTSLSAPNLVILTHPDSDHVGGLTDVVQHYGRSIGEVWVHDPASHMLATTYTSLKARLQVRSATTAYRVLMENLDQLETFLNAVDRVGIPRVEPFYPLTRSNIINVLGPSQDYYEGLLPTFEQLEEFLQRREAIFASRAADKVNEALESLTGMLESESPCPVVDEENETTAINQSSAVIEIRVGDRRYIFPGDAGVAALIDVHARCSLSNIYWLAVPHHGSRRNLCSELISLMSPSTAYISAKGTKKHPRQALVNCLKKHRASTYSTHSSGSLWHHWGTFPERSSYSAAKPL